MYQKLYKTAGGKACTIAIYTDKYLEGELRAVVYYNGDRIGEFYFPEEEIEDLDSKAKRICEDYCKKIPDLEKTLLALCYM